MSTGLEASSLARESLFNTAYRMGETHGIEILGSSSSGKMKYVNG